MSLARRFGVSLQLGPLRVALALAGLAVLLPAETVLTQGQQALVAGRNVNMVSGTKWPDGDPYLQRQNEPSIAGSTRNPQHLLGGANDYRSVDIPFVAGAEETGDAWLGLFKSYDGGQRWRTTLLPGYPQDTSPEGLASPIYGYQAGADPVVRAGTNGLFYYAGLVFDREEDGRSAVFVARFVDNNNQEDTYKANPQHVAGDPIAYLGTRLVARNNGRRFLDKPWIAVDVPRNGRTCRIPAPDGTQQVIPAGNVYVAFSSIYEDRLGLRSDILLSRSTDCGVTWSVPTRVNDSDSRINQGATIAIDPRTGAVQVAWRRFASAAVAGQTDGIFTARSVDAGDRFSAPGMCRAFLRGEGKKVGLDPERYFEHRRKSRAKPRSKVDVESPQDVGNVDEFDQTTSGIDGFLMFRTNAYPSMAIDGTGRIYLAWAERGFTSLPGNDARIVMASSTDGRTWSSPQPVADEGQGHQIMPSLTFGGGRLVLVYYDLREDVSGQFTQLIDDKGAVASANRRHTLDLRASMGTPGQTPAFAPSVRVSDYLVAFRMTASGTLVEEQVQFNPPNLPMFKQGTAPFMGDYVDVTVSPAFVPTSNGRWAFNTSGALPVFHAVWTDNRDVRQPKAAEDANGNGNPWDDYTPPTSRADRTSVFDPSIMIPPCDPAKTGSRNQNVYTARLSLGLVAGSPGNAKPLSPTVQRAFVVFAQNTTEVTKRFRLDIVNQPTGGRASFDQFSAAPVTQLFVTTPARSMAARSVYATSTNPNARIEVTVNEVPYNGSASPVPLSDVVILNPDIANPDIANPDIANPDIANPDIANAEVYNPDIANPDIANPDIANPDIANTQVANPDIANPDIANPDIANPDIANPDIANPDIANTQVANPDIANPDIANPDIANPDIANPDIANPDIANPDIANGSLSDVTWTMTNNGNTTAAFNVNLFLAQQSDKICPAGADPAATGCIATQLILRKVYNTPVATGCELQVQSQNVTLANISSPRFVLPGQPLPSQNSDEPTNATLWLAPGETAKITLRVYDPEREGNVPVDDSDPSTPTPGGSAIDQVFLPTTTTQLGSVTPVVRQQSVDTQDAEQGSTQPPIVTPLSPPVPSGDTEDPAPTPVAVGFVQQPTVTQIGSTFAASVRVLDQYGAPLPNADVTLFVGNNPNPPEATVLLSGNTATSGADGIAVFPAVSLSPAAAGYTIAATSGQALPAVSAAFDISPLLATIELGALTQTYDGGIKSATVTTSPGGLLYSLVYSRNGAAAEPRNAGHYDVAAAITTPNYAGTAAGTLVINKATPTITWATPAAIAEGTALGTQLNATSNVAGTFAYTPPAGTVLPAGAGQVLSVTFTPTDASNYEAATAEVTIDVTSSAPSGIPVPGTSGGAVNYNNPLGGGTVPVVVASVQPGDQITISATGTYSNGIALYGPGGAGVASGAGVFPGMMAPSLTDLALVARIAGGDWQYVGPGPTTLTSWSAGTVELAVNDDQFADNTGALVAQVSVSAGVVPLPVTLPTATAGGPGGSPFGPYYCPAGQYAVGLRVATNGTALNDAFGYVNYAVTTAQILCSGGYASPKFGGGTYPNADLVCAPGEAMVGIDGAASGSVLGSIGPRCQALPAGAVTPAAQVLPGGGAAFSPVDCEIGQVVVGVQGRQGAVLDQLQLLCAVPAGPVTDGLITLGAPVLMGGAVSVPGLIGQAFGLTNPAGANQYVSFGDSPDFRMTNAVSMVAWIYPTGPGNGAGEGGIIINKEDNYEVARFTDGTIRWAFMNASPGWNWIDTGATAPLNQWTHVVVTYDAIAGLATTYVNGVLRQSFPVAGPLPGSASELRVGGRAYTDAIPGYRQNFDGLIDEVAVYNRALTAAEAQQLFNNRY